MLKSATSPSASRYRIYLHLKQTTVFTIPVSIIISNMRIIGITILLLFMGIYSQAQQTNFNNDFNRDENRTLGLHTSSKFLGNTNSTCNGQNTFWGMEQGLAYAKEFELTGNTISYTGNLIPMCSGCGALAICNNLNGGSPSPTFYTGVSPHSYYWDGNSTWIQNNATTFSGCHCNAGGNDSNLYFHDQNYPSSITKYDGTTYTTIFSINKYAGIADIAVDIFGNIYFVSQAGNYSDSLYIISPNGQILNQYSLIFDWHNAYGCFLLNNTFYIGLGPTNPVNPNVLLPVTISNASAVIGTPIPMPPGIILNGDLASCFPGSLTGIITVNDKIEFEIYPNPAKSNFIISLNERITKGWIEILNIFGESIYTRAIVGESKMEITNEKISQGVYFVKVYTEEKNYCKKLIIE